MAPIPNRSRAPDDPTRSFRSSRPVIWLRSVSMHDPVIDEVLVANLAFYEAHEQRDIEAMAAVWEHSDRVVCIHPGC